MDTSARVKCCRPPTAMKSATSSTVSAGFAAFYPRRSPLVPFQALPPPWLRAFYHITRNALAVVLSATTLQVVAESVL